MSEAEAREAERADLHAALQTVIDKHRPGALLTGWIITAEVGEGDDGGRTLMHRTGALGGGPLTSWTAYGFAGSTFEDCRDQLRASTRPTDDDPPSE